MSIDAAKPPSAFIRILLSIWSVLAGFILVILLSEGTDAALHAVGMMPGPDQSLEERPELAALALAYRALYDTLGSFVTGRLAPSAPMVHVWIAGGIAFVLCLAGVAAALTMNIGPLWYPVALAASVPLTTWLGGKLALRTRKN